jgi:hypothetical protein
MNMGSSAGESIDINMITSKRTTFKSSPFASPATYKRTGEIKFEKRQSKCNMSHEKFIRRN